MNDEYKTFIRWTILASMLVLGALLIANAVRANGRNNDNVPGHECEQGVHTNNPHCNPSPTVQPTATPTPSIILCDGECEVTPTPTVTVEPTREPTQPPSTPHEDTVLTNNSTSTPGVCIPREMKILPSIWGVGRDDKGNVYGHISKTEDYIDTYVVWYGLYDGDMRWNTTVKGNDFSIGGTSLTHIWLAAQSTDGCGTGNLGAFIDP